MRRRSWAGLFVVDKPPEGPPPPLCTYYVRHHNALRLSEGPCCRSLDEEEERLTETAPCRGWGVV